MTLPTQLSTSLHYLTLVSTYADTNLTDVKTMLNNIQQNVKLRKTFDSTCAKCQLYRKVNLSTMSIYNVNYLLSFFLFKIMFANFFKMLVLAPYLIKCIKPVSISLFILKGLKPVVFLIRNKLFKILNFFLYVVLSAPLHYLYVCFLDVGLSFHSKICNLEL